MSQRTWPHLPGWSEPDSFSTPTARRLNGCRLEGFERREASFNEKLEFAMQRVARDRLVGSGDDGSAADERDVTSDITIFLEQLTSRPQVILRQGFQMTFSAHIVPPEERFPDLKDRILQILRAVLAHPADGAWREESFPFVRLVSPWLADLRLFDQTQRQAIEAQRSETYGSGFHGDSHVAVLESILSQDTHLNACCRNTTVLAFYLDRWFINPALQLIRENRSDDELNSLYQHFENLTYNQGRYSRTAYTHIFNLHIEADEIDLGDVKLVRVHESNVPALLGERSTSRSFLHPPNAGNVFLSVTEVGISEVSDDYWLGAQRLRSHELVTILQYLKDGIVNVGYSVLDFNPPWVNELRKFGLVFIGDPRRLPYKDGTDRYELTAENLSEVKRWETALRRDWIRERMGDSSSQMRLTIERAGTYYEGSLERTQPDERLISLSIALESLFSPSDQSELSFRICQFASLLIGADALERRSIFASLKEMYKLRSKLVHGAYDVKKYKDGTFVQEQRLRAWADLIRRSILSFIILFLRGYDSRAEVHGRLESACFDEGEGYSLRLEADVSTFLQEQGI